MKLQLNRILSVVSGVAGFLALSLGTFSGASYAGPVDLSSVPLTTATTTKVLPNLMYIQDNSGSMNWDYIPDKVVDGNYCKGGGTGTSYRCCRTNGGTAIATDGRGDVCNPHGSYTTLRGMPPFQAASFNRIAYNPAITYALPVNADGTNKSVSYGTDYGAVPYDGYGIQTSATVALKTDYPDVEWCTTTPIPIAFAMTITFCRVTSAERPTRFSMRLLLQVRQILRPEQPFRRQFRPGEASVLSIMWSFLANIARRWISRPVRLRRGRLPVTRIPQHYGGVILQR
jgi:hypothetical protein